MYDDDETLTHIEQTPDKVLADRLRQEKAFANFKFSKKHISFLKDLMKIEIQDHLESKLSRFGRRLEDVEKSASANENKRELRDLTQDHKYQELEKLIAEKEKSAKSFVVGIGFMVTIIMGLISKYG